jgi:hypothetical protein
LKLGYLITENDEFVHIAEGSSNMSLALPLLIMELPNWPWYLQPGQAHLVDFLTILKYIPEWFSASGASFQQVAHEGRELSEELQNKPFTCCPVSLKIS